MKTPQQIIKERGELFKQTFGWSESTLDEFGDEQFEDSDEYHTTAGCDNCQANKEVRKEHFDHNTQTLHLLLDALIEDAETFGIDETGKWKIDRNKYLTHLKELKDLINQHK